MASMCSTSSIGNTCTHILTGYLSYVSKARKPSLPQTDCCVFTCYCSDHVCWSVARLPRAHNSSCVTPYRLFRQVCNAAATVGVDVEQEKGYTETKAAAKTITNGATTKAPKCAVGTPTPRTAAAAARPTSASVFREFEVEVRPEPPPPPAAADGRSAEDTLMAKMGLGGEGE